MICYQHVCNTLYYVIPAGTSSIKHLDENLGSLDVHLSKEELDEINSVFTPDAAKGDRYPHMGTTFHYNDAPAGGH
jgi:diketogulonate reductase-like aldo/keto reductase